MRTIGFAGRCLTGDYRQTTLLYIVLRARTMAVTTHPFRDQREIKSADAQYRPDYCVDRWFKKFR